MKAIILAAGRGSRMGEKTANMPKCMMELWGRPLIEHCVDSLKGAGFAASDIGIVTGYRQEMICVPEVNYFHNADWESTNMFVSLTMAAAWLHTEPCVVSYADIIFSEKAVKKLMAADSEFAITYYTGFWELWSKRFADPLEDLETFRLETGKLVEIGKKPKNREEVQGQYMGLLKFSPSGWRKIEEAVKLPMPKTIAKLDMTTLLQHLLGLGYAIEAIETGELWLECDNERDVALYEGMGETPRYV
jgi:choline kinase